MTHARFAAIVPCLCAALLTACAAERLTVRGTIRGEGLSPLPPDAHAIIELRDTAPPHAVVAEQRVAVRDQALPVPFELVIDRATLVSGRTYAVRAAVKAGTNAVWASDPVEIEPARASSVDVGALVVKPVIVLAFATTLDCGGQRITVGMAGETLSLLIDGRVLALRPVPAASGERFEAVGEPSTSLWTEGQRATLVTQGREHPPCVPVDAAGAQ